METLGKITVVAIIIAGAFLAALLNAYVILSVSNLYQLSFITQFSFIQVYGILAVISLAIFKYKKEDSSDGDFTEKMTKAFTELLTVVCTSLLGWGFSFLAYYIIS
jgi:hypothetical protein